MMYRTLLDKEVIKSDFLGEEIYNLLDQTFKFPVDGFEYTIFEVTPDYIARPDLISYDMYETDMFGDIICKLNGISNPFELNEGMKLIIPSPGSIMEFSGKWDGKYTENNLVLTSSKPKATKKTNSKRKANEAIVGDSRFKIDSKAGIIIY